MSTLREPKYNPYFFRRTGYAIGTLVLAGMTICHFGAYDPFMVPDLGPLQPIYNYMAFTEPWIMCWVYHGAVALHLTEALMTIPLTLKKGVTDPYTRCKWFLQTALFGIFSLKFLLDHKPLNHQD